MIDIALRVQCTQTWGIQGVYVRKAATMVSGGYLVFGYLDPYLYPGLLTALA